jgi:hypothetical protein
MLDLLTVAEQELEAVVPAPALWVPAHHEIVPVRALET